MRIWNRLKDYLVEHRPSWKLEINILTIFLLLFTASFILIISYTYKKNKEIVLDYTTNLMQQLSREARGKVASLLGEIKNFADFEKTMVNKIDDVSLDNKPLIAYMFNAIRKIPNLSILYINSINGTWIGFFTLEPPATYQSKEKTPLPEEYKYALLYVDRNQEIPTERWIYYDSENKIREVEEVPVTYDARNRPWFQKEVKMQKPYWTDVFIFFTSHDPGFAYVYPIFDEKGKFIAAGGGGVELSFLSSFMKVHKLKESQGSMLFTKKGNILAFSGELSPNKVINVKDKPLFDAAYQIFLKNRENAFLLSYNGDDYIASLVPFSLEIGQEELYLLIIIPKQDLLDQILSIQENLYLIFFCIIVVTVFFILIFSKKISKPIVDLSHEIDRLKRLDLQGKLSIKSHIKEICQMRESVISLKSALESFSTYVPKELVYKLLDAGKRIILGGKREELTIMFTDICNFTTITETIPIENLMQQLEEYFDKLSTVILNHHGTIDKYIGDAIMAFWGAPEKIENHSLLATEAALACQQVLKELNKKWILEGKTPFYTRIGLHEGCAIVGNIGTSKRMNYTIMGDAVNLASRLEGVNKTYQTSIVISEALANKIGNEFLLRPLDVVQVKGKKERVKIFELIAKQDFATADLIQLATLFTNAYEAFEQNDFKKASTLFQEIQKKYPEDYPTKIYIERLLQN